MSGESALEPLGAAAALVVVDMQRLFAEATEWRVPDIQRIVPAIAALVAARPESSLFTRFVTPKSIDQAAGGWQRYYRRWSSVTLARMPVEMLDLVPELMPLARLGSICDKTTFSAFGDGTLPEVLAARGVDTLVLAGVETDVCVLATALDAIDRGYRVVIAVDAVTSWSLPAHQAAIDHVLPRFSEQIAIATAGRIAAAWQAG